MDTSEILSEDHHHEDHPTHHEIAVRAYEIWKQRFGDLDTTHQVEVQIWLVAEAQLIHHYGGRRAW
jgi:hypothetical protein